MEDSDTEGEDDTAAAKAPDIVERIRKKDSSVTLDDILTSDKAKKLKPTEVYLSRLFIEEYAIKWREIGLELNLTSAELNNILVNHPDDVKKRCRTMLNVWLQRDPEASWGKLLNAMQNADIYRPNPTNKTDDLDSYSILAVFEENYGLLHITITDIIDPVVKCFVDNKHLTVEEEKQITAITTTSEKIDSLLIKISSLLKAGNSTGFHMMLKIMREQGGKATQTLADHLIHRLKSLAHHHGPNDEVKGYIFKCYILTL